ncbi:MAG: NUDIX hydrolase [Candidatus Roizmanbacteria bacterium]|nr:NUDIX hydrolase [Candidatus Roizmanbacteria bacterium]
MNLQYEKIKSVLDQASHLSQVDESLLKKFYKRLEQGDLVRDENPDDHFSTFFIPFVEKKNLIFLGDHIKSGVWLVPGGHIDSGEGPVETVVREIDEELDLHIKEADVEFFDLSITDISSPYPCKRHYDLWYLLRLEKPVVFNYTKKEFKAAQWMSVEEAIGLLRDIGQADIMRKL